MLAEQDPRPTIPTLPPKPVTIATAGSSSVLPSPSLGPPTTNTALPFAGWGWGQPTLYSPFCATSGSVAGTPAVTDGLTPSLTSGTNTYLQAAICQELDGKRKREERERKRGGGEGGRGGGRGRER